MDMLKTCDVKSEISLIGEKFNNILATIKNDSLLQIASRGGQALEFKTFNKEKIESIALKMEEINRANNSFGRTNTQVSNALMTLTMLNDSSPYRLLRQCGAQIEDRRKALKENMFLLKEKYIRLQEIDSMLPKENEFDNMRLVLEAEKIICDITDSMIYIEGTFKDIASFQNLYLQIKESNNIPDNWDEIDFEEAEINHHLRIAFLHAYRDVQNRGAIGMGTLEYIGQFGVHPFIAHAEVHTYIIELEEKYKRNEMFDINHLTNWLNLMVEKYKNESRKVLNTLGIKKLIDSEYLYTERNKAIEE